LGTDSVFQRGIKIMKRLNQRFSEIINKTPTHSFKNYIKTLTISTKCYTIHFVENMWGLGHEEGTEGNLLQR
jgi:hypothetical protein